MHREYALVRPYPGALGLRVQAFVEGLDLTLVDGQSPAAGTTDDRCVQYIVRTLALLFVVPFHMHRGAQQEVLDGVSVLQQLPPGSALEPRVFFMPVRDFSFSASFQRRVDELKATRPEICARLLTAHEEELDSSTLRARLRRMLDEATFATARTNPAPPRSRRSSGHWTFPPEIFAGSEEARNSSLPPPSTRSGLKAEIRPSSAPSAGKIARPEDVQIFSLGSNVANKKP